MSTILEIASLVIIIIIVVFAVFYFPPAWSMMFGGKPAGTQVTPVTVQNSKNQVCFGQNCFFVELATTNAERDTGLMNRTSLEKDKGMLFIFDKEGIYPFWMKNTLIPLDMIWMNSNHSVVYMAQNMQPCKSFICPPVIPLTKANYVLEINAGIAGNMGIKLGDTAQLRIK